MLRFQKMRPEQRTECALLTARAFADYAYFKNYVPDDEKRHRFLECMMKTELRVNEGNEIFLTAMFNQKLAAMAALYPPGVHRASSLAYLRGGFYKAFLLYGFRDICAWLSMDEKAGAPCHGLTGKTWYLNTLVVDPSCQGMGIGSRFLQKCIIPFVKKSGGEALCLYTNAEINRAFYQKNGFQEFDARTFYYHEKSLGSWSYRMEIQ